MTNEQDNGDDEWEVVINPDGSIAARRPWCDDPPSVIDRYTERMVKRSDGHWVRPCCFRAVNRAQWLHWQEQARLTSESESPEKESDQ